jgi:RHS repeat-associated protein
VWDYLNRMLASGYNNSTTTYAYDPSGARVLQTSTTSTTYYPNKYYSLTSTKAGSNTYATSTNFIWNGDTLLATVDQPLYNGAATGTAIYRYIHPDHLGSTNVVTDQNGALVQLMDYYPYGATRIATSTYPTNEKRQYIGQFSDAQTNLNYLNARFYDSARGQFLSEDPIVQQLGDASQLTRSIGRASSMLLSDPQKLNSYSYSIDNPIIKKDPTGKFVDISSNAVFSPIFGPGVSGAVGVRIDSHGAIGYTSPGGGWGEDAKLINFSYTPGDIPRDSSVGAVVGGDLGPFGYSYPIAKDGSYGDGGWSFGLGLGADVYVRKEYSRVIFGAPIVENGLSTTKLFYPGQSLTAYRASDSGIDFGSTQQSRAAATTAYNAASGATANESKLWVTPNGAVVNWGGLVIVPAINTPKAK